MYIPPKPETEEELGVAPTPDDPEEADQAYEGDNSRHREVAVQKRHGHLHVISETKIAGNGPSRTHANKTILLYNQHGWPDAKLGTESFAMCPVKTCTITKSKHDMKSADAVLFKDFVPAVSRPSPGQIWVRAD